MNEHEQWAIHLEDHDLPDPECPFCQDSDRDWLALKLALTIIVGVAACLFWLFCGAT